MSGCGVGVVCSHLIVNRRIQRITKISVNYCKFQMIIFDNSVLIVIFVSLCGGA